MAIQSFLSNRTAAAPARSGLADSSTAGGFQRLFEGTPQTEGSGKKHLEAPQVEVIEENGRVVSIVVTCRCCERIEIACRY